MLGFCPPSPFHPHPEGHFHVLPSPDLHLVVVGADVLKVGLGDGEEAAGKRRGSGGTEGDTHMSGMSGICSPCRHWVCGQGGYSVW